MVPLIINILLIHLCLWVLPKSFCQFVKSFFSRETSDSSGWQKSPILFCLQRETPVETLIPWIHCVNSSIAKGRRTSRDKSLFWISLLLTGLYRLELHRVSIYCLSFHQAFPLYLFPRILTLVGRYVILWSIDLWTLYMKISQALSLKIGLEDWKKKKTFSLSNINEDSIVALKVVVKCAFVGRVRVCLRESSLSRKLISEVHKRARD